MARKTNRREFVQVAGLAASGFIAAARPLAGAIPEPQAQQAPQGRPAPRTMPIGWLTFSVKRRPSRR